MYAFLADAIAVAHLAYVSFVVLGQVAILVGLASGWGWARNPWFRSIHLVLILIVGTEAILNIVCPLTTWERDLRILAGQEVQEVSQGSFVGEMVHTLLACDVDLNLLQYGHIAFAVIVLATFVLAPPCWRKSAHASK